MVSYDEIRDYIIQQHGKRVSNKWIAEIKRNVGMLQFTVNMEEENPQSCPKEAEKYIIEAFEHFGILEERNDLSKINDQFTNPYMVVDSDSATNK